MVQWGIYLAPPLPPPPPYLTGDEDKEQVIDEFILAQSEEEAIKSAGDPMKGAHWHHGPYIWLFDDYDNELKVIAARFKGWVMDSDIEWVLKTQEESDQANQVINEQ